MPGRRTERPAIVLFAEGYRYYLRRVAPQSLQVCANLSRVLVSEFAVLLQAAIDNARQSIRNIGIQTRRSDLDLLNDGDQKLAGCISREGSAASAHLIEQDAEREEVCSGIDLFAERLLRGHVCRRPQGGAKPVGKLMRFEVRPRRVP